MVKGYKILLLLLLLIGATFVTAACTSSEDIINDTNYFFAAISRVERITPGGMGFTDEQAQQLLDIINPVVTGVPYTSDLAKEMYNDANKLLTAEQKKLLNENMSTLGTQQGSGGYGMGAGGGYSGEGVKSGGASGTGVPGSGYSETGDSGINMFLKLDDIITTNYLK